MHIVSNNIGKCKKFEERKVKNLCAPWKASSVVELRAPFVRTTLGGVSCRRRAPAVVSPGTEPLVRIG
jgi:hypothetical protein